MGSPVIITPDAPQVTITPDAPVREGAISRFVTHATGIPVADIKAHPQTYNPFSKDYWQAARDNAGHSPADSVTARQMVPFGQTKKDLDEGNYAGALGDVTPGVIAAAQIAGPLAGRAMTSAAGQAVIKGAAPVAGVAIGAKVGSLVGEPITGAAAGAWLGKQVSPAVASSFARLGAQLQKFGLQLTPQETAEFGQFHSLPAGPRAMPGEVLSPEAPAYSPSTRAQRLGLLLKNGSESIPLPGSIQESVTPPFAANTTADRLGRLLPANTPSSQAVPLPESSLPAEVQQRYPGGLQSRPQARTDIVDDKAVQDAMRLDLDKHGWNALSEEKQRYYADNAPQFTKRQLIAQEQARALVEQAQSQAQQILTKSRIAAETPAKFTKTIIPKSPVAAAAASEPVTQGLDVNQDLTDILQRSLDAVKARKGK